MSDTDTVSKDGTDGLETVSSKDYDFYEDGELVTRSQAESEIRKVRKDAEELLAAERAEHDNTIATLSSLIEDNAELNTEKQRMLNAMSDMSNTNKKLTARIKELEAELDQAIGVIEDRSSEYEALEAKLAAAEKALESYKSIVKDVCESQRGAKWGKAAECIFDAIERAALGGKPYAE